MSFLRKWYQDTPLVQQPANAKTANVAKESMNCTHKVSNFSENSVSNRSESIKPPESIDQTTLYYDWQERAAIMQFDGGLSREPTHGKIVIAVLDGELTVKRLHKLNGTIRLMPENEAFEPIEISNESELTIWGVVTNVIHGV